VSQELSSKWDGLHPTLLASIYQCDRDGVGVPGAPVVISPPIEGSIELSANWQSPFENMGPESKAPALMAMLQTGMITNAFMALTGAAGLLLGRDADIQNSGLMGPIQRSLDYVDNKFAGLASDLHGISGMTKLNATQVFTGSAPLKIPLTLLFRAFSDAKAEVQAPIDQLAVWTLPETLSVDGAITGAIRGLASGQGLAQAVFPSRAPKFVALRYAGYLFAPLVIESISHPLVVQRTREGHPLQTQVQISLASVTALDQEDWRRARNGTPIKMFQTRPK
jgi:hypothetical protein